MTRQMRADDSTILDVVPHDQRVKERHLVNVLLIIVATMLVLQGALVAIVALQGLRQSNAVQEQNDAQLCALHDTIIAIKSDATISQLIAHDLGLPTAQAELILAQIVPPDVSGIVCP